MNLEMMKQLLQEFSEKEALTTEEIKAIQQQSQQLELRVQKCRAKLENINQDKHKIDEMRSRYAVSGNGAKRSENLAGVIRPRPQAVAPPPPVPPEAKRSETTIPASAEVPRQSSSFTGLTSLPEVLPQAPTAQAPLAPAPAPERPAASALPPPTPGPTPGSTPASRQLAQFFDDIRPASVPTPSAPSPIPQFNSAADILTSFESMSSSTPTLGELPPVPVNQQLILNEPDPDADQAPPAPAAAAEEEGAEGPDETVKSINDALRGLFR